MKKSVALITTAAFMMGFAGCSFGGPTELEPSEIAATTLCAHSDGTLEYVVVEDFSRDNYDLSELNQMINDEISDYNSENGAGRITLDYIDKTGTICTVSLGFLSSKDAKEFQQEEIFIGTVKEALDAGYDLNVTLKSAKDLQSTIGITELAGMGENHIVICENANRIRTDSKILYLSDEAKLLGKYEADGYMNDAYTIVVFK